MASPHSRTWTDARDGSEWEIVFNPGVELESASVRASRERLLFRGEPGSFAAPAVYGSDLETLTDRDLQGLLDQARERSGAEEPGPRPGP